MFTKIRNNPKKTIFFSCLISYGGYYSNEKLKENNLRRIYCDSAKIIGDQSVHPLQELTKITVIHNPIADGRKSAKLFQKNIFPLLNLSGYKVKVVETERAEEAKELMAVMKTEDQDCVFVAGGDGTLLEVATGLLRRSDLKNQMHKIPLVLSPLGASNTFVNKWFQKPAEDKISACRNSVDAIENKRIKPCNAMKIRLVKPDTTSSDEVVGETSDDAGPSKEIFAMSGLEWSIDRDVQTNGKRKWMFGPYRCHVQYMWTALMGKYRSDNKSATVRYREQCLGCSSCIGTRTIQPALQRGYISSFARLMLPMYFKDAIAKERQEQIDYSRKIKISNPNCGVVHEKRLDDVRGLSVVMCEDQLQITIKQPEHELVSYIKSGVNLLTRTPYDTSINDTDERIMCEQLTIIPDVPTVEKFYIDNEQLDAVPVEISVLKNALYLYS